MSEVPHYKDYFWKKGKPVGRQIVPSDSAISYKIVTDPYKKRFSIEKYTDGSFHLIVYDSYLFDFRHLSGGADSGWQREVFLETETEVHSVIRSIEERIILKEKATFNGRNCMECSFYSPHGLEIGKQKMYYKSLGESFNGVILYDLENKPVMTKKYEVDEATGEFTTLLSEVC